MIELYRAVSANSPEIKIRSRSRPPILINQECAQAESREVDRLRIDNLIPTVAGLEEFRGVQSPLLCHRLCQKQLCLLAVWRKAERKVEVCNCNVNISLENMSGEAAVEFLSFASVDAAAPAGL